MPTLMTVEGVRVYFYANEKGEPPHVHVEYQGVTAKIWLSPISLASSQGLKAKDISRALKIVKQNEKQLREKWDEFFSKAT